MNEKAIVRGKLLELLAQAGFAERYYAYCDTRPLDFSVAKPTREAMQKALAALAMPTRYHRSENLYVYEETHEPFEFSLGIAVSGRTLEMILGMKTRYGAIGGTYHGLAGDIALLKDPTFARSPPYPRICISKAEGLAEALDLGVSLFHLARARSLASTAGTRLSAESQRDI